MTVTVTNPVHFGTQARGRRRLRPGVEPLSPDAGAGRVPRVARLMALAIRFEGLLQEGAVADQAEIARLGHVTRARVTQVMNFLNLATDIQEALLFLPEVVEGRDPISERDMRPVMAEVDWERQRGMWRALSPWPPSAATSASSSSWTALPSPCTSRG